MSVIRKDFNQVHLVYRDLGSWCVYVCMCVSTVITIHIKGLCSKDHVTYHIRVNIGEELNLVN